MKPARPRGRDARAATRVPARSRNGRAAIVAGIAAASFLAGAFAARPTGTPEESAEPPPVVGARSRAEAAPTPTRDGAVAAATAFLEALRWRVLIDDTRRIAAVRRFSADGVAERLDHVISRGIEDVRRAVRSGPVVVRPVPIGHRVDRFEPPHAAVSIWGMALFGTAAYEPVSQWATSRVDLVWQENRWKVAAMRNRGGPSPRWSIEELAHDAASFDPYRYVP